MPVSKNALIRYKTIDRCLGNRYRRWTLEDREDGVHRHHPREAGKTVLQAGPGGLLQDGRRPRHRLLHEARAGAHAALPVHRRDAPHDRDRLRDVREPVLEAPVELLVEDRPFLRSVKRICIYAFSGCTNLFEVWISDGLERVEPGAFVRCRSLQRIIIEPGPPPHEVDKEKVEGLFMRAFLNSCPPPFILAASPPSEKR